MKKYNILLGILMLIFLMVGCRNTNSIITNTNEEKTKYYIIENGKKIYFKNNEFMKNEVDFDSILNSTVKSLNEVKDGKRDLDFIKGIESEELKRDEAHKIFSESIPGNSSLKTIKSDIKNYTITGLQYDKNQNLIKVFISIEVNEKQEDRLVTVLNTQTYVYKVESNMLLLTKYDLSQYLQ